jgi:putative transposase
VAFILEKHLRVQGVGEIPIKLHRPITGKIKTVSVKREGQQWYACFSVECEPKPLPARTSPTPVGIAQRKQNFVERNAK